MLKSMFACFRDAHHSLTPFPRFPDEVVITDETLPTPGDGTTSTPSGEPADDFFSSWDKPTIKRPSNPPSRSATPPVVSRTASPFLSAGASNGAGIRPKSPSPLAASAADAENALSAPTAIRTTSTSAIRKAPGAAGAAKRTNILGAKKNQKLGAKKVAGDEIDFEAAEKAAKAEAERIEKLGYDPEAEQAEAAAKSRSTSSITKDAPSPIVSPRAGPGSSNASHTRSPSEVERLGMGVARLGFGMTNKPAGASSAPAPKKLGFGSVGASKAVVDGEFCCLCVPALRSHHVIRTLTNHQLLQTTTSNMHVRNLALKKAFPQMNSLAATPLIPLNKPRPKQGCKDLKVPHPSRQMRTLGGRKTTQLDSKVASMGISRQRPRISSERWD